MYFKKGKEMLRMNSCLSLRAVIILQHRLHISGYQEPPSTVTDNHWGPVLLQLGGFFHTGHVDI